MSAFAKVNIRGGATTGRREYACDEHGPFDLVVEIATSSEPKPCPECGAACERTVTATAVRIPLGTIARGKYEKSDNPLAMDTRPLAEGQPLHEWKAERKKKWEAHDRAEMRKAGFKL